MMNYFNLSKRRIVITIIVSFLLTMMTVFGYQIEHYSKLLFNISVLVVAFFLFITISIILIGIYKLFDKATIAQKSESAIKECKVYVITCVCLLVIYAIQFLGVYPGLFVFDASWQYWMYIDDVISEHHPVFHTVLLGFIVDKVFQNSGAINHGAAAYIIFQVIICVVCISYFITFIYKKWKRRSGLILMIVFFGIYPPIVLQVMSATKDTFFFAFILLLIALTIELAENSDVFFEKPLKVLLWILSAVLVIILRNNCIYAIPFFVLAIFCVVRKKKLLVVTMLGGVFVLFMLYRLFIVSAFVTVEVDGREMYSVPSQQLMRIYNSEEADISEDERKVIDKLFVKDEKENYHPKIADLAKGNLDMIYYRKNSTLVNKTYLSLVKKNFKMSVESFLENTCGFWYPGCELTMFKDGKNGYWVVDCYDPVISNPKIKFIFDFYKLFENSDFVTRNPVTSLLFSPGTFFYIFVIMFAYAIERKKKVYIPIFVFMLALWLTYLLGPVALVRYIIYFYAILPLYFVMISEPKQEEQIVKK